VKRRTNEICPSIVSGDRSERDTLVTPVNFAQGSRPMPSLTGQASIAVPASGDYAAIEISDEPAPNRLYSRLLGALGAVSEERERWLREAMETIDVSPTDIAAGDAIAIEPELRAIADSNLVANERALAHARLDHLMHALRQSGLSSMG
jgi:hypothetical protein